MLDGQRVQARKARRQCGVGTEVAAKRREPRLRRRAAPQGFLDPVLQLVTRGRNLPQCGHFALERRHGKPLGAHGRQQQRCAGQPRPHRAARSARSERASRHRPPSRGHRELHRALGDVVTDLVVQQVHGHQHRRAVQAMHEVERVAVASCLAADAHLAPRRVGFDAQQRGVVADGTFDVAQQRVPRQGQFLPTWRAATSSRCMRSSGGGGAGGARRCAGSAPPWCHCARSS